MFNSFSQLYARVNPLFLTDFRSGGVAGSVFNSSNPFELFVFSHLYVLGTLIKATYLMILQYYMNLLLLTIPRPFGVA